MKGHSLPGVNQKGNCNLLDGRAKSSAFQSASCSEGGNEGGECGDFKNKKKGTVVSRLANKVAKGVKNTTKKITRKVKTKTAEVKKKINTVANNGQSPRSLAKNPNFQNVGNSTVGKVIKTKTKAEKEAIANHKY